MDKDSLEVTANQCMRLFMILTLNFLNFQV